MGTNPQSYNRSQKSQFKALSLIGSQVSGGGTKSFVKLVPYTAAQIFYAEFLLCHQKRGFLAESKNTSQTRNL